MNIIEQICHNQRNQNFILENNKDEVEEGNLKLGYMILVLGCLLFLLFLLVSIFVTGQTVLTVSYTIALLFLGAVVSFFNRIKRRVSSRYIVYGVYSILVIYGTVHSTLIIPGEISVIILCFFISIPIVTLDKSWKINLVVILYGIFYVFFIMLLKDANLRVPEILNSIAFATIGMFLGGSLRMARLENFELKRQALIREKIDYLTQLYNRKGFVDYLKQGQEESGAHSNAYVIMIDIDYFKQYNDTYGHQMGDVCLQKLGKCLQEFSAAHNIMFARYGGEEFVGLTSDNTDEKLIRLCNQLNQAIYNMKIPHKLGVNDFVTVSIGISTKGEIDQFDILLLQADMALYKAKSQGRNCTVLYKEE